jgi:hypothetical protein
MTDEIETEIDTYETSLSHDILTLNLSNTSKKAFYEIGILDSNNSYNNRYNNRYRQVKKNIRVFKYFRHLWYCLQYKKQFKKWLWEKVREPKIKKLYDPIYLIENLGDEDDLDEVLKNWEIINNRHLKCKKV